MNRILIGGSPSTGSSLFRTVLNRHSQVFCGPETWLFCFPSLYRDWNRYKSMLIDESLRAKGNWHMVEAPQLLKMEYGWTGPELEALVMTCESFEDFADAYFGRKLVGQNAGNWAEKSPPNACYFDLFAGSFKNAVMLHTVRHPLDSIASMTSRGHTVYFAAAVYLLYSAFALRHRNDPRYFYIKYEELVSKPVRILEKLCRHIGVDFEDQMLVPASEERSEVTRMRGWGYDETDAIGAGSIGRFSNLSDERKQLILTAVNKLKIDPSFAGSNGLEHKRIAEVASELGYPIPDIHLKVSSAHMWKIRMQRYRDIFARWRRGHGSISFKNYPLYFE